MSNNPYTTRRKTAHDDVMPLVRTMVDEAMKTLREEFRRDAPVPVHDPVVQALQQTLESVTGYMRSTASTTKKILHVQKRLREDFNDLFEDVAEEKMAKDARIVEIITPTIPTLRETMLKEKEEASD